ncbi:MAG: hypothetical protein IKQ54_07915 [Oscillospiraceae bacterium]|nr:hypothetical protein [Oscillospiraceae bacterium]
MPGKNNFPSREERKQLIRELRELEKSLGKEISSSELYRNYVNALNALDQKMESMYELGSFGLPPTVTEEDQKKLTELLLNVGRAGEQFLGDAQEKQQDMNTGMPRLVNRIQGMLAKDYEVIASYNPKRPMNLPVLQELSRTHTIDLRGKNIKTLGNMQSSRIPMTFHGPNGEKRTGVFTKANYVKLKGPFQQKLEQAKALCGPDGAAEIDSILSKARDYHVRMKARKSDGKRMTAEVGDDFMAGYVLHRLKSTRKMHNHSELKTSDVKEYLTKIGVDAAKIPDGAFRKLTEGLGELQAQPGFAINGYGLELKEGQRLDQRNSAMSVVAGLLGVSFLLARSDNMRFVAEDGTVTEGTFMDYGKGLDLGNNEDLFVHFNTKPTKNAATMNGALRSIADLQILDLLCLNVDRHQGNVMYRVDPEGNFTGLQGIDNDSSFGPRELNDDEILNARVVSKSMADKLKALTPEMLKFALRGSGLSEEELKNAGERLTQIQEAIDTKMLKVVPDNQFSKTELKELCGTKSTGNNLFDMTLAEVQKAGQRMKDSNGYLHPYREGAPKLSSVSSTQRIHTVGGLTDLGEKVSLLLENKKTGFKVENLTGIFHGSSPEFDKMVESARMVEHAKAFLQKDDPKGMDPSLLLLDDPRAGKAIKVYHNVFMDLREKTTEYLLKKMDQRGAKTLDELTGNGSYEQKRIDYAKKLLGVTEEYLKMQEHELTEQERQERSELLELRSTADRMQYRAHYLKQDEKPIELGANLMPEEEQEQAREKIREMNKPPEKEQGPVLQ